MFYIWPFFSFVHLNPCETEDKTEDPTNKETLESPIPALKICDVASKKICRHIRIYFVFVSDFCISSLGR